MISIIDIVEDTTVDGPGFRTAIYAAGCPNRCPGCHNPASWDICNGHPMSTDELLEKVLADDFADVTFSGGDPMFQPEGFAELAKAIKQKSRKNIWCYTGYTFENLLDNPQQAGLLHYIDVLVDGKFRQDLQDESLRFRGSSNQRIIDVPASLKTRQAVPYALPSDVEGDEKHGSRFSGGAIPIYRYPHRAEPMQMVSLLWGADAAQKPYK